MCAPSGSVPRDSVGICEYGMPEIDDTPGGVGTILTPGGRPFASGAVARVVIGAGVVFSTEWLGMLGFMFGVPRGVAPPWVVPAEVAPPAAVGFEDEGLAVVPVLAGAPVVPELAPAP